MIRNHPSHSTPAKEQCLLTNIFFGIPEFASPGLCYTVEMEATVSRRFHNSCKPPDLHVLHHQRHAMYIWRWASRDIECRNKQTRTTPNRRKSGNVVVLDARYMQICYFFGAHSKGYLDTTQVHSNLFEKKKSRQRENAMHARELARNKKEKKASSRYMWMTKNNARCPRRKKGKKKGKKKRVERKITITSPSSPHCCHPPPQQPTSPPH
jgi:hypothetical protein